MYYQDDMYHPTNRDDESVTSADFSANSWLSRGEIKRARKEHHEAKMADKGYYYYRKWHNQRSIKVEMYDSGNALGSRIRDPMTGARLKDRIGSKGELDYFKVRYCGLNSYNPVTLFYDSPEHYERHHRATLSDDIKEKWWRAHRTAENPSPVVGGVDVAVDTVVLPGTAEQVAVTVIH